ncbi:hypothetical protein DSM112329_00449 [Paraconexibacter sp. AEG42_29]|uniref:ABC transporter permease n=1 Tax=Paraconexibacter sp. AEG42_29 TaxID=2997339 RepID=A0AAU7APM6_9ACTN
MIRLIRVELLKLITTKRTTGIFLAVSMGLCLLISLLNLLASDDIDTSQDILDVLGGAQVSALFVVLIFGAVNMGGEARHGTQVATFLATPVRWRVIVAKSIAHALAGVAAGALNVLVGLLCIALFADAPWPSGGDLWLQILGGTVGGALIGSFGVAMGAVLRNQVAAVAGTLVYLLVVEPLLGSFIDFFADYGIFASLGTVATAGGSDGIAQGTGGIVLLVWMLSLTALGAYVVEKRDIRG